MLDRMISGAGAVTDGADRSVRLLTSGSRRQLASTRPGSLVIAGVLVTLSLLLVLAGLEATDPSSPVEVAPADAATSRTLGDRTYSNLRGSLDVAYVETFSDDNHNGVEDVGENGIAWYYWLVDPDARAGVTVRSTRPPSAMYTFSGQGVVTRDPHYLTEDRAWLDAEVSAEGLQLEPTMVIDETFPAAPVGAVTDLTHPLPSAGTVVQLSGPRLGSWTRACHHDRDSNGRCDPSEADLFEIVMFEPTSRHAIRAYVVDLPEFSDASVTGLLRREERAVDDALTTRGLAFADLDLKVSDRYILDDAAAPGRAPLAFALAAVLFALALVITCGLAGGYLIFRRGNGGLPAAAATLPPGGRIPLRMSGIVRTPNGMEHVREAPGELVRFILGRSGTVEPVAASEPGLEPAADDPADEAPAADEPAVAEEPAADEPADLRTTLVVERLGYPHGIELGLGSVDRVSSGTAMAFRAPRPAIRVGARTGPLILSFDTDTERDRAVAELLAETGLGPDGRPDATP